MNSVFQHDRFLLREQKWNFAWKIYVENEQEQELLLIEGPPRRNQALCAAAILVLLVLVFLLRPEGPSREVWNLLTLWITAVVVVYAALHASRWNCSHLTFYRDARKSKELCNVAEESWSLFRASYKLRDAGGVCLGSLHRERGRWRCEDSQGHEVCRTRMVAGAQCFFVTETDWKTLGDLSLKTREAFSRLYCILDLANDPQHRLDSRLALAVAAMLVPKLVGMEPD